MPEVHCCSLALLLHAVRFSSLQPPLQHPLQGVAPDWVPIVDFPSDFMHKSNMRYSTYRSWLSVLGMLGPDPVVFAVRAGPLQVGLDETAKHDIATNPFYIPRQKAEMSKMALKDVSESGLVVLSVRKS